MTQYNSTSTTTESSSPSKWVVQTRRDFFEDVHAADFMLHRSGALVFYSDRSADPDRLVLAYAPGQWITLHKEDE
jgi:hypothetical protein